MLCSIIKWCWSRIPDGVVSWPVYEGFHIGEEESNLARNAFDTFIPISVDSEARKNIIFDFYDLVAAVAAHGKLNGLGGRKVSRLAGWWAFEHSDDGKGFEGGYKSWKKAADASSHLFFAYLRSLSPEADPSMSLIERIPRSLQSLLASTEYPPETPSMMQRSTPRVVMLVDSVSPTPFALLRRAKHFEYRDNDRVLREYSEFEDPVDALTDECKRVLYAVSSTNSSAARSRHRNATKTDESWSQFSNLGFSDIDDKVLQKSTPYTNGSTPKPLTSGLRTEPRSRNADHGRPTTPSWADFLSAGFSEEDLSKSPTYLVPPDKQLPPIRSRAQTPSQIPEGDDNLAPGELAAIKNVDLDDAFWWVWMTSLAAEEPAERKAVFGRCALIETTIMNGRWLIMEEQVKGASPDPAEGAYVVQKKSFFSTFKKGGKLGRKKSTDKKRMSPQEPIERAASTTPSKSSLAPDQQSKIKQVAAALKRQDTGDEEAARRRGRHDDAQSTKTNSMLTLGLQSEAGPAMKWMGAYDKDAIRKQYLGDAFAGTGMSRENLQMLPNHSTAHVNGDGDGASSIASPAPVLSPEATHLPMSASTRDLPALPQDNGPETPLETQQSASAAWATMPPQEPQMNALPSDAQQRQQEAEEMPLPEVASPSTKEPSAMEKELAVDTPAQSRPKKFGRKPVYRPDEHPAFRASRRGDESNTPKTPTSPTQNPAAIAAQRAMAGDTSPESTTSANNKFRKPSGADRSGLKKMFGRKRDNPNRQSTDGPQQQRQARPNALAPPEQGLGRRISLMRKKPSPVPSRENSEAEVPQSQITEHPNASELEGDPVMPASNGNNSTANLSHVDSIQEHQKAKTEFARFDQGPVDMPAATPDASDPEIAAPRAQRTFNTRLAQQIAPEGATGATEKFETPMERSNPIDNEDAQSEATMEEPQEEAQPAQDRWAMIRENAAKRAARANEQKAEDPKVDDQRASEEQSTQSRPSQSARTDDGETSGEESE